MKNFSIKRRLILAFAATILLSLISIGVAEIGTWSTGDKYQEVLDKNVASDAALLTARIKVNTAARYIRDMAIAGYSAADETQINTNLTELKNTLALFNVTYAGGDGKAAEYTQQVEDWMAVVPKIVAEIKAGNALTATEMIKTQCTPALNAQSATAAALTQASNQLTEEHVNTAHTIFIVSMCVVIGLAVLSLIFVVTMAGKLIHDITVPMDQAEHAMEDMSRGDFSRELTYVSNNEIGRMIEALRVSRRVLEGVVSDVDNATNEMANGNFNVELTAEFPGSLRSIHDSVMHLVERMNDTLSNIAQAADQVAQGADQMADNAQSMAQGAAEQASSVEELSAAISSISNSAKSNTALAKGSMNSAMAAGGQVDVCSGFMKELVVAMNGISKSSEQIGNIISTIENIAFQTNILALNAAVEAARAGAAGKGFAVVADEVRNLASKSDEAAKATKELIENSIKAVDGGNRLVKDANGALEETVGLAGKAVEGMGEVAQAVMNETEAITEVTNGINQISNVVQTNSATAEESAAASQELSGQADLMHTLLSGFHLRGAPDTRPGGVQRTRTHDLRQQILSAEGYFPGVHANS